MVPLSTKQADTWGRPNVRKAIKIVERDGWYFVGQRGSHRHFKHPTKPGKVTIAGQPSEDVPIKIWRSILNQAGLNWRDWR